MPAIPVTLRGVIVSVLPPKAYSFTDDTTGQTKSGVSRKAYLVPSPSEAPVVLSFNEERAGLFDSLVYGVEVDCRGRVQRDTLAVEAVMPVVPASAAG